LKNIVLSAVAVLAMSSFAVAGGDIAPVEEPVVVPEPVVTDSGFYLGGAYSYATGEVTITADDANDPNGFEFSGDEDFNDLMFQIGYKFNQYVAIEGRYWWGLDATVDYKLNLANGNDYIDQSINAFGIYVKPMYPVTDAFDIYGLLGYASAQYAVQGIGITNGGGLTDVTRTTSDSFDGFSWGLGAAYSFTDSVSIFIDYVSLYDDTVDLQPDNSRYSNVEADNTMDTWNFGVTYKF